MCIRDRVQTIPVSSAHLNRVAAVNQLSREIEEGRYTVSEVRARLDEIRCMPGKTRRMQVIASGVGSACFCYLFGGNMVDSCVAFGAGVILYLYVLFISGPHLSKIVGNIGGGALVTFLCTVMFLAGVGYHLNFMIIGSKMCIRDRLNGLWEVEILEGTGSVTEEAHFTMMVPGCVESLPGLGNFRGKCRFSKEVRLEKNGPVKLIFYGVSFLTEVYWDGEKMADHYNAYTEFDVVLPEQSAGVHTLELVVDNSWNEDISALHIPNDYQSYNGITRPVELAYICLLYTSRCV